MGIRLTLENAYIPWLLFYVELSDVFFVVCLVSGTSYSVVGENTGMHATAAGLG